MKKFTANLLLILLSILIGFSVHSSVYAADDAKVEIWSYSLNERIEPVSYTHLDVYKRQVSTIPGRANCLRVKLTNLRVVFKIRLYDNCKKYITTVSLEAVYLPAVGTTNYNPDTNPRSVTVDMYAPYGASTVYNSYEEYYINYVGSVSYTHLDVYKRQ